MIVINQYHVLNLERREDRRNHIIDRFSKSRILNNRYSFFEAIDGRELSESKIRSDTKTLSENAIRSFFTIDDESKLYGVDFTNGSYGILLTYLKLCEQLVESQECAMVFEDDIILETNFDDTVEKITSELPDDFEICYLGYCAGSSYTPQEYSDTLVIPVGQLNCLYGFIISPKGAQTILNMRPYEYQIDTQLYLNFGSMRVFCSKQPIVKCTHEFFSDGQI